ncbi:MAG: O-antigen ligase family protein, partial [Chitinophagaceae bacterium]|nr:O-antigen ligase family protein [Chitinophagaceae bacterium]
IILALLGTIWGYFQEYIGFLPFEQNWIMESPQRFALLFQAGTFRKFSFFSDPLVYGILLAITATLCFVLASGPFSRAKKILLLLSGFFMMNGMLFSGTRAAFILPVVGLVFYGILTFKKQVIFSLIAAGIFLAVIINIPTSNPNIVRLQTAFKPTEDASYQVRMKNQAFIRPFILSHPLGGGLGSVGEWGKKFSPWSPLANFPPDSGFVRIAVEGGWLGLLIYSLLLFTVFYIGIKNYLILKNPKLKVVSLGMLIVLFSLTVANYPQEAIGQYPINLLFFVAIAVLNVSVNFDKNIKDK